MKNYQKAVEIYTNGGQYAVYDAVNSGKIKATAWINCIPCEDETPFEGNACLVCGSTFKLAKDLT